jgi:Cu+-exporting ATPase
VLIKSAEALEQLAAVTMLFVDKTGTLTEGRPKLAAIVAAEGFTEAAVLHAAASLERASEHAIAAAIVAAAKERGVTLAEPVGAQSLTGLGVAGSVDGRGVVLGSAKLMQARGIALAALEAQAEALRRGGATVLFAAIGGKAAGLIVLADTVKAGARAALDTLRADGVEVAR